MNLYEVVSRYKSGVNVLHIEVPISVCFSANEMERGYNNSTCINGVKIDDALTFGFYKRSDEWIHFKNIDYGYVLSIKK